MLVNLDGILKRAQREKYAVGLFNTNDTDMLQAAIEAAEELVSPIGDRARRRYCCPMGN